MLAFRRREPVSASPVPALAGRQRSQGTAFLPTNIQASGSLQMLVHSRFFATVPVHMRQALCLTLLLLVARAIAAERHIDFSLFREGEMPAEPRKSDSANDAEAEKLPRFHSTVT